MQLYTVYITYKLLYIIRMVSPRITFSLQSATSCIRFWLAKPLSSNYLYSVLLSSNCICLFSLSSKPSPPQRVLGLPIGLLAMGFQLLISCTIRPASGAETTVSTASGTSQPLLLAVATVEELRL